MGKDNKGMMMKISLLAILPIALISSNLYAHGVEYLHVASHKHGVADVAVEWQEKNLTVTAVFPGQDVVGFEHIPTNAKEKRVVRDAYQVFIDNPVITAKGCEPKQVNVSSALFDEHAHGESNGFLDSLLGEKKGGNADVPEHMDFQAVYQFSCDAHKQSLKFMSFPVFTSLKQVNVHQGKIDTEPTQTLNPKQFVIKTMETN